MGVERRHLLLAIIFGVACGLALLLVPRLLAALSFYLGYESLKELFFARLGLSGAISDLMAGALVFFFPMATYIIFVNMWAVLTGRAPARRLIKIFAALPVPSAGAATI